MTVETASFAARTCAATCSADRTIPSSSFSTPSAAAIRPLHLRTPPMASASRLMLGSTERPVFVELSYPHIIGIRGYRRDHDPAIRRIGDAASGQRAPFVPDREGNLG